MPTVSEEWYMYLLVLNAHCLRGRVFYVHILNAQCLRSSECTSLSSIVMYIVT